MRHVLTAEILAVGTELTVGETRDTNSGDLARELTAEGVVVRRMSALPDDLVVVRDAVAVALGSADLVVLTGGLGPTPDDLTREAISAVVGEAPVVDPGLEAWLRGLFERRHVPFPAANLKQAWLIPSATTLPNDHGTAPGWWVDRPDGRVVVALPGPPREMWPMWRDVVVPRLRSRGLGGDSVVTTLRTTAIGESLVADRIRAWLEGEEPSVATYARGEAVDIRISGGREAVAQAERDIRAELESHVWATGATGWGAAIAEALDRRHLRIAMLEVGTRGALVGLLGEDLGPRLLAAHVGDPAPSGVHGEERRRSLEQATRSVAEAVGAEIGLGVRARAHRGDIVASIAVVTPVGSRRERRLVFLSDVQGRHRAAIAAAATLLRVLQAEAPPS